MRANPASREALHEGRRAAAWRRVGSAAPRAALSALALVAIALALLSAAPAARAATTVSSPGTVTATASSTVALSGYRITGATGTNVLVTISTSAGSLKLSSVSGMTAATGYSLPSSSATFTTLSMWGTPANANASLATLSLVAPGSGSATVTVNSANYDANVTYNAANGHYYRFVSSAGTSWSSAKTAAEASTYLGKSGYLVTITSSAEDTFVQNNTTGTNIWIGHTDQGLEGLWRLANSTGMPTAEKDLKFWRAACVTAGDASTSCSNTANYSSSGSQITYANWCANEPNNSDGTSGEDMAVTKWNSGTCWNDLRDGNTGQVNGYMIEYGDDTAFVDASAASASQTVAVSASSPSITTGSASVRAGTAISLGGWAIANMASSTSVLATVQTTSGSLGLSTTTGLTRAPGHTTTSWTSFTQLAFRGTVADVNAALATLALTAADAATPTITVTATPTTDPTATYHFASGHYYTRVDAAMSVSAAQTESAAARLRGKDGYLAAITTTAENTFVESFTGGYQNLWANGTDVAVGNTWRLLSQAGMPAAEKNAVMTYFDWCSGQPDNWFGEEYVSLNYLNGACWNDTDASNPHPDYSPANPTGLVVEYGDDTAWSHASSPTASQTVTVDGVAPTVSAFTSAQASPTNAASIAFTLTFSKAVTGVAAGDFSNSGTATCTFNPGTDSGSTRTVTATCTTGGTVIPVFASGGAADSVGNTGPATAATATTTITRDVTAPTATFTTSQTSPMYPGTITYTLTFPEAVTGVAVDDFSNAGSAATCAFAPGTDSGSTRTVTITGCGPGTVTPRFAAGGATDAAGNTGPTSASTATTTITIDDPVPGAPTGVVATGQDQSAVVSWTAPAWVGSSAILDYTVTAAPGGATCTATAPATTCTVSGLANGTTYSFTVTARNAAGTGAASSSASAVPVAVRLPTGSISLFTTSYRALSTYMTGGAVPTTEGFSGTIRATVVGVNATVKVTTTTGLVAVTGYASANWTAGAAEIAFDGTPTQVNAALATLAAQGTTVGSAASVTVSITPAGAAYFPTTGHFYELVTTTARWREARCLAKYANATYSHGTYDGATGNCTASGALVRRTSNGLNGYLATVTSAAENQFITTKIGNATAWIGGSDIQSEGSWRWMDGPEAGKRFFVDGTCADGLSGECAAGDAGARYNFWNSSEPNNAGSGEHAVQILSGGTGRWNDLDSYNQSLAYVVEYGGDGGTAPSQGEAAASGTVVDTLTLATPSTASYTDTTAVDTFASATGTLVGTHAISGTTLTYGIQSGVDGGTTVSRTGTYGTLTVTKASGAYTFAPNTTAINARAANASETFTVTVTDGSVSATATYTVSITGVNDGPVATTVTVSLADTAANDSYAPSFGTFAATDAESNTISSWTATGATTGSWLLAWSSGSITFTRQLIGTHGTLYIRHTDGAYRFEPNAAAINGRSTDITEAFALVPADSAGANGTGALNAAITAVNDRPVVTVTISSLADVTQGLAASAYTRYHTSAGGGGSSPGGEGVAQAFDNDAGTKYLNFSGAGSGVTIDLGVGNAYAVTGIGLTTANDETARDPASYQVLGSNDGTTFTSVSSGSLSPPTGRQTAYPDVTFANAVEYRWYRVVFPTIRGGGADAYLQVSEIRLPGSAGGQLAYTEGAAAGTVLTGIDVADPDAASLAGGTVAITAGLTAGDELSFANDGSTMGSIGGTWNAGTGVLTLSGTGTPTQYQNALRAVKYRSTSGRPTATSTTRTVTWQLDDGQASANLSSAQTSTITVIEQNQAPVLSTPTAIGLTDTAAADTFADVTGTLSATDADGDTPTFGISSGTAGSTVIGGVTYTVSRVGTYGTLHVRGATGAYRFVPNATAIDARATDASETFTVSAGDGTATGTASLVVSITAADDTPTLATPTAIAYTDTTAQDSFAAATGTLAGTDREGTALVYGISGGTDAGATVTRTTTYGTLTVTKASGAYSFAPSASAINQRTADDAVALTVTVTAGALSASATLDVSITGSREAPAISWSPTGPITYPAPIDATQHLAASAADATTATAVAGTLTYTIGGQPLAAGDVLGAGTHTLRVDYAPTGGATADYVATHATATLVVQRASQTITAIPADTTIAYGESTTLSAGAYTGTGTITYRRVSGPCSVSGANVSTTGAGSCVVEAQIAQSANHLAATSAQATIAVDPATLTVTAQDDSKRQGTADPTLTALITGYVGSDGPGVLTAPVNVTRAGGEGVGTYAITASGAAAVNYVFTYVPGTFTIRDRDVPVITWSTPTPLVYGTALTSAELNATASFGGTPVPGTFAYAIGSTPIGVGSVIAAGPRVLTATFTPTDAVTYASGTTGQTTLTVTRKPLTVSGATAADKRHDGTATATVDLSGASLVGIVGGDAVTLDTSAVQAAFDSPAAGSGKPVTVTGLVLAGADSANYTLSAPALTAAITATAPGTPTGVNATVGSGQATVEWTAPASDGGSPITGYVVTASPGGQTCTWTSGPLSCVVTGLTDGVAYTFSVVAVNAAGSGAGSTPTAPVTPSAAGAVMPTDSDGPPAVSKDGSVGIQVGCSATARACTAAVSMYRGSAVIVVRRETIEAGTTEEIALELPTRLQRQLAEEGVLTVRIVTLVDIDGSTVRVESTMELEAPPADMVQNASVRATADGSAIITAECVGTIVSRCEGVIQLFGEGTTIAPRAGRAAERVIVGKGAIAGPTGRKILVRMGLTEQGRRILRRSMALRVTPVATMQGDTRLAKPLAPFTIVLMSPRQWLQRALSTLYVGGRPREDLNILLDQAKRGVVPRAVAANRIERRIIPAREAARARAAALPVPPRRLQPIATQLLRAFDQSLAANRAYVQWLRSDRREDDRGWRLSLRATETKTRLMAQLAEAGRPYGLTVPAPSMFWP